MYNYSIIIPHKNIPHLLQRCLNSIPQREDLEVIVVDDDSSPEIVDFNNFPGKSRNDTTIILDKSGKGGSHARNIGIEHAKGKWVLFADADDFYNYCINDILNEYVDEDVDIIFFKVNSLNSDDYSTSNRGNDQLNFYIDHYKEDELRYGNLLKYKCGVHWSKIIRKSVIDTNNITYEESILHNDHRFAYILGYSSKRIKTDRRALYCMTTRMNSASKNVSEEALLTRIRIFGEAELFFKKHDIPSYCYWDWHITQLAELYLSNNNLFPNGCEILLSLGYKQEELNRRLYDPIHWLKIYRKKRTNIIYRLINKFRFYFYKLISFVRLFFRKYPSYVH